MINSLIDKHFNQFLLENNSTFDKTLLLANATVTTVE